MNKINWAQVVVFGVVALLVFLIGASLLGGYTGWGMRGPGMMGSWGFGPFGWLMMIFMWLFPVGLLALLVLGIVWLVQQVSRPAGPGPASTPASAGPRPEAQPEGRPCPHCGRPAQTDWRVCPYCGQSLA